MAEKKIAERPGASKAAAAEKNIETTKKTAERHIAKGKPKADDIRNKRQIKGK